MSERAMIICKCPSDRVYLSFNKKFNGKGYTIIYGKKILHIEKTADYNSILFLLIDLLSNMLITNNNLQYIIECNVLETCKRLILYKNDIILPDGIGRMISAVMICNYIEN